MDKVYCPNSACPDYQKTQDNQRERNIIRHGKTRKGTRRFRCKTCGKTFTETVNTIFYRRRKWYYRLMTRALLAILDDVPLPDVASELNIYPPVLLGLVHKAVQQDREKISEILRDEYEFSAQMVDGFWTLADSRLAKIQDSASRLSRGTF
jgi:transposase-like protein